MRLSCVLLFVVLLVGCSGKDSPTDASETPIAVAAETLWMAYNDNAIAAGQKYDGKLLKVTGPVYEVLADTIVLDMFDTKNDLGIGIGGNPRPIGKPARITCRIAPEHKSGFAKTDVPGFAVVGRCKGQMIDRASHEGKAVLMVSCWAVTK